MVVFERVLLTLLILSSMGLFAYWVDLRWQIVTRLKGDFRRDRPGRRILRFVSEVVFQSKVIRQRRNLADAHSHPSAARLNIIRLNTELGDGWPAVDLNHTSRRAERIQRFFD